ncbi:MAG: CoA transferase, partial [Magnetospirillum sp.]
FPTADGHLIIAVGNDGQFAKLAEELGQPHWAEDERFTTNRARVINRAVLIPLIEAETLRVTSADLLAALEARQVPCGPINTVDKVFEDPQVRARRILREVPHPLTGTLPTVASPLRLSDSAVTYERGPPLLGQHTDEVLGQLLGLDRAAVEALRRSGVV